MKLAALCCTYHRPHTLGQLIECFLRQDYPRHIQIHYGQYQREELYAAARQSRACAYLADDDHGPLALQELLLLLTFPPSA